ncbi:STAS domain-containing protein [Streptomyces sp. NPDC001941]|uniref:STAS domain-containing protein n=1 Tax=Streptomyces sp. NPDC001941 TaxID=3154659 RepID=UPI003317ABA1
MPLPSYRLAGHQVVKVYAVIDIANAARVGQDLDRVLADCPRGSSVVVDLRAPLLTAAGLDVLEHAHETALRHGLALRVTTRHALVRKVLRITGAEHLLDVHRDLRAVSTHA